MGVNDEFDFLKPKIEFSESIEKLLQQAEATEHPLALSIVQTIRRTGRYSDKQVIVLNDIICREMSDDGSDRFDYLELYEP